MTTDKKKSRIFMAHYLTTCRLDNWLRLLKENRCKIVPDKVPQLIYMLGTSLLLTPFTLLESLLFAFPIRNHKIKKDPVFIIGHWRSGTTYLQNLLSKDQQFGWCDPVSTTTFCNSYLLGWLLGRIQEKFLGQARPMDNMKYSLDLPMEDVFALNLISTHSIIHLLAFPANYKHYLKESFIGELSMKAQQQWERSTMYVLKKISMRKGGKQLILKSPDHTCHLHHLRRMFPNAKYINIHRDPYVTIMSTINMFDKQTEVLGLNDAPENLSEILEDELVELFAHMYENLFDLQDRGGFAEDSIVDVAYDELSGDPAGCLKKIYDSLGLEGYEAAEPYFEEHIRSVSKYVKNKFDLQPRLRDKVNARLGFYFERYGYEMQTAAME